MLCSEASSAPANHRGAPEVVLGNTSSIRKDGSDLVSVETLGLLSGAELRPFWVCWARDRLSVGHGETVGKLEFLACQHDTAVPIAYLAFAGTWGHWTVTRRFTFQGVKLSCFLTF